MKHRFLALLTALCLLLGLAACNKQPAPDEVIDNDTNQTDPAPTPEPEPEPEPAPADPIEAYVDSLPLEQQVAQMFFVRCPETDAAALTEQYNIGGYILFGRDFEAKSRADVEQAIQSYQDAAATPMLIGVDEEGGTVVRVSYYEEFRDHKFQSPQQVYADGGMPAIIADTVEKDALLKSLGINVNLAPVCDVSTDPNDFIYARAFGQDATATSDFVRAVVIQMVQDDMGTVLKHFPGYGSNVDTHTGIAIDNRPLEQFRESDFLPFQAGFGAGAGAVLVCHNVVTEIDPNLPASLSPAVHDILRNELGYQGVAMTDDLIMEAITDYTDGTDAAVLAVQAGNDMLISSDFETQYQAVLDAIDDGRISQDTIRQSAIRVVRWKNVLGLL